MLRQILRIFQQAPGPMSLDLLAIQLDLAPSVLEGMLAELVAMGRLTRTEGPPQVTCRACNSDGYCPYVVDTEVVCYSLAQ